MKTQFTQAQLDQFVAGLIEEGPLLEELRADLRSPDSQVSQYLERLAQEAQLAFQIDWSNLMMSKPVHTYNSLLRCFGPKLYRPQPVHRTWYFFWYVCGRRYFANSGQVNMDWKADQWEAALRQWIQDYAARAQAYLTPTTRITAEEADSYEAILEVLFELKNHFRTEDVQQQQDRLSESFLLDVIDAFIEWDDPRWHELDSPWFLPEELSPALQKLLAFTCVIGKQCYPAENLEPPWRELLLALRSCLQGVEPSH